MCTERPLEGIGGMSRRRKHGDSPLAKSTPRRAAAAEERAAMAEAAGAGASSRLRRRRLRREDGNPEERYETPTRVLKMDLSRTFSSPNDQDGQNDIFWDQNSPMTKQLGKGRKHQISLTDNDEISHIVSRIAPQDEAPMADSMLGVWIGAAAIPCTPREAKEQARVRTSCTRLKTQKREKELMKLAEQFDKNMEELDVIQQHKRNWDSVQSASETETFHNCRDYVQKQSCDTVPGVIIREPGKGSTGLCAADDSNSSQKPFDPSAEAALNAIFDASTQRCSGQLSQDPPDAPLSSSDTSSAKNSLVREEKNFASEPLVTDNQPSTAARLRPPVGPVTVPQARGAPCAEQPGDAEARAGGWPPGDLEEDWEHLLGDEPFAPNPEMRELCPSTTAQDTDRRGFCTAFGKQDKARTNINLDDRLGNSKLAQDLPSNISNRPLIEGRGNRSPPDPNDKSRKLPFTGNKMKLEKSVNKIVIQDKIQDCVTVSDLAKENCPRNLTSNAHALDKSGLNTRCATGKKAGLSCARASRSSANTDSLGSASLNREAGVGDPNQPSASKVGSVLDDWSDPSFANEIIEACHQLEAAWDAGDVDDDVLYQACDDVERLTQQEGTQDGKAPGSALESGSQHGARSVPAALQQGSLSTQSKPSQLSSSSVHTSWTDKSQINKSVQMEKKQTGRTDQDFSDAPKNVSVYSKNSGDQISNLQKFGNNVGVPIQRHSPKSVLAESSRWNVSSSPGSTEPATTTKSFRSQHLSHSVLAGDAQSSLSRAGRFSKFTFTKMKSQFLSPSNQDCIAGNIPATKITQDLEKKQTDSSFLGKTDKQPSLVKRPGSWKQPSREEEEKNRKCSPEEIQRKRQEALVRRMAKARASSVSIASTSFLQWPKPRGASSVSIASTSFLQWPKPRGASSVSTAPTSFLQWNFRKRHNC